MKIQIGLRVMVVTLMNFRVGFSSDGVSGVGYIQWGGWFAVK
jgi:hypothetical protein